MTTRDGGNTDIAGVNICPSIHGHNRIAILALCGIPSIHGHKKGHWVSSGLLNNLFENQYYNK
jgi:hypothetical protein